MSRRITHARAGRRASRRVLVPGITAMLLLAMTGCGDETPDRRTPAATPEPSVSLPADLAGFQEFAGVTLPPGARDVTVEQETAGTGPRYLVSFSAPADAARDFCAGNGLGGVAAVGRVDATTREEFDFTGDPAATFRCQASMPADPAVQRRVLAEVAGDVATVRVIAFRMPPR